MDVGERIASLGVGTIGVQSTSIYKGSFTKIRVSIYLLLYILLFGLPGSLPSWVKFVRIIEDLSTANTSPSTVATLSVMGPIYCPKYRLLPCARPDVKYHVIVI